MKDSDVTRGSRLEWSWWLRMLVYGRQRLRTFFYSIKPFFYLTVWRGVRHKCEVIKARRLYTMRWLNNYSSLPLPYKPVLCSTNCFIHELLPKLSQVNMVASRVKGLLRAILTSVAIIIGKYRWKNVVKKYEAKRANWWISKVHWKMMADWCP